MWSTWFVLQLNVILLTSFLRNFAVADLMEGCVEAGLTLRLSEMKVSGVVQRDDTSYWRRSCCNNICSRNESDAQVSSMYNRYTGQQFSQVQERITCNDWNTMKITESDRIIYRCFVGKVIITFTIRKGIPPSSTTTKIPFQVGSTRNESVMSTNLQETTTNDGVDSAARPSTEGSNTGTTGMFIGGIVGAVVVIAVILLAVGIACGFFCGKRRNQRHHVTTSYIQQPNPIYLDDTYETIKDEACCSGAQDAGFSNMDVNTYLKPEGATNSPNHYMELNSFSFPDKQNDCGACGSQNGSQSY